MEKSNFQKLFEYMSGIEFQTDKEFQIYRKAVDYLQEIEDKELEERRKAVTSNYTNVMPLIKNKYRNEV